MSKTNWSRHAIKCKAGQWGQKHFVTPLAQTKVVPVSTNVICPHGQIGRVVDHRHGLNVVINATGTVIGSFATADLRPYPPK